MGGRGGSSGFDKSGRGGSGDSGGKRSNPLDASKMPELTGTEKQVKWASDIRKQAVDAINASVKFYEDRLAKNPKIVAYQDEVRAAHETRKTLEAVLTQISSASKIIDGRGLLDKTRIKNEIQNLAHKYELEKARKK
ncbi:hypothetical protein [uncultured Acetatifactor sp.]|uniref:hypothetical protein n=1 Tax=uncultured Acetatifactor sp. TaxID=1671927 RepID=UPI002615DF06|nr:hypothetical protein [uncultured Acetatifactor sp.]